MAHLHSPLLALPEALLHEVSSWSPSASAAAALHSTCRTPHRLRHDPAAAALLLLRCPCQSYPQALQTFGTPSGTLTSTSALCRHFVLQLLRPSPGSGRQLTAPAALLHPLLVCAAGLGDTAMVEALMALPQPPDVDACNGGALLTAMVGGPHLGVLQALLNGGADPCVDGQTLVLFRDAAGQPAWLPALRMFVERCPAPQVAAAALTALKSAAIADNIEAVSFLLPHAVATRAEWEELSRRASDAGSHLTLQLLVNHPVAGAIDHWRCLYLAVRAGHASCVTVLLDAGADVNVHASQMLMLAVMFEPQGGALAVSRSDMVRLLLQRGAAVTPDVHRAAEEAGLPDVLALLRPGAADWE